MGKLDLCWQGYADASSSCKNMSAKVFWPFMTFLLYFYLHVSKSADFYSAYSRMTQETLTSNSQCFNYEPNDRTFIQSNKPVNENDHQRIYVVRIQFGSTSMSGEINKNLLWIKELYNLNNLTSSSLLVLSNLFPKLFLWKVSSHHKLPKP